MSDFYSYYTVKQLETMSKLVERFNADVGFKMEKNPGADRDGEIEVRIYPFTVRGRDCWIDVNGNLTTYNADTDTDYAVEVYDDISEWSR